MTNISEISEFELIKRLEKVLEDCSLPDAANGLRTSIGDDAAVIESPGKTQVVTTDTMVEGVHFLPDLTSTQDIGWKIMAVNYSDIASMGCDPFSTVITLGIKPNQTVEALENLYKGCKNLVQEFGGYIVGGDIVRSDIFFVSATVIGTSQNQKVLMRDKAKPGDLVGVTGHLGCSAAGLNILTQSLDKTSESSKHFLYEHKKPYPRIYEGKFLLENGVMSAMDLSDGLVSDLGKLCCASKVSAEINLSSLPVNPYLKNSHGDIWKQYALNGGEDYELIFTAPQKVMDVIAASNRYDFSVIGKVTDFGSQITIKDENGNNFIPVSKGWDHFNSN